VRVDCLNAVLNALAEWEVPLIMIPGNHDQVSLGGLEHALTPLQNAFRVPTDNGDVPGILIFTHPTKFRGALFVPHIRDIAEMQSILQSQSSASSSAVFVHADVTGASMNDLITSTHGVAPEYFPPSIPIYSGHFHKPHVVERPDAAPGVSIRYVGSPYETTLAEANQVKALLVLSSNQNWKCVQEIPIQIGKRHWRCKNIEELVELQTMTDANMNDSIPGPLRLVKAGDRVVVSVYQEDLEELRREARGGSRVSTFDAKVKELRAIGASVEIRELKYTPGLSHVYAGNDDTNSEHYKDDLDWLLVEDMSPFTTWSSYLASEVKREAMKDATAEILLKAGNDILDELGLVNDSGDEDSQPTTAVTTNLVLDNITVEGFGPFRDSITYPLKDRGLVLLRGSNRDGGSDR
jgi:DNA repair exonuclease SbcCD nuclease subunit